MDHYSLELVDFLSDSNVPALKQSGMWRLIHIVKKY